MNRNVFAGTFVLGAMAVVWVAFGFLGTNHLALLMTLVIGAVYGFGALELHRFRQVTATLAKALNAIPDHLASLDAWLCSIHPSLQNPVRLRIEGERVGLPGPAMTPYLVGLLVMLGMLGTFLGMVVTLNGAVFALEGTTDLQAIRSAFAAPIKGLGLSFGTSVAGVAASAMLGLMSAISRRERMVAAQLLDERIGTVLRSFSLTYQRQETFKALQLQSQALPAVVDQLQTMMTKMDSMSQKLNERLLHNQESFHQEVKVVYTDLAHSVNQSLRSSLTQSAHAASESIRPVVVAAMSGISQEARLQHERMVETTQAQLDTLAARLGATASTVTEAWTAAMHQQDHTSAALVARLGSALDALGETFEKRSVGLLAKVQESYTTLLADRSAHERQQRDVWMTSLDTMLGALKQEWQLAGADTLSQQQQICSTLTRTALEITEQTKTSAGTTLEEIARLTASSEELARSRITAEARWTTQHGEHMDQLVSMLRTELGALREEESSRGAAAVARLSELQTTVTRHLTTLGTALEEPITRLIHTASEAPRAAAEVIGNLRQEVSNSVARDNELLEERSRIMGTLSSLLDAINHASVEQRAVIDALVASSAVALGHAGTQFAEQVDAEAVKLSDIAAHVTSSAVEVSTLSETLSFAMRSFNDANEKLIANLQRIEGALDKSMARSDDQLAYYVAQAREIIDLSIMSQKEIIDEMRQLPTKQALMGEEVAG